MQFGILGNGSWATALAKILTDNRLSVNWWVRSADAVEHIRHRKHNPNYLSSVYFDTSLLTLSSDAKDILEASDTIVVAIPSAYVSGVIDPLPRNILKNKKVVSAVKGIIPDKNQLLHDYLESSFDMNLNDYVALLGPCHAEEVAAEKLSYLTFSSLDEQLAAEVAACFKTPYINTNINHDIVGVQYASVLKNIYALGAGIAHGLEYGDNFLSVYISNAAHEMIDFAKRTFLIDESKPDRQTISYAASAYLGDLLVTCYSLHSRNRMFGNMIGKGYSVKAATLELNMVAEGYNASKCIFETNRQVQAFMPIAVAIYDVLWNHVPAEEGFKRIEKILV